MTATHMSMPIMLRGYGGRRSSVKCTLLEALLATLSDAQFFPPVAIGESISEYFVATSTGHCNPTNALFEEVPSIFKSRSISFILNIGSSRPGPVSLGKQEEFASAVLQLAKDCDGVAQSIYSRFSHHPDVFLRLNVDGFELSNVLQPGELISHSRTYLGTKESGIRMRGLIQSLMDRPKRLKVHDISGLQSGTLETLHTAVNSVLTTQDSRILEQLSVSSEAPFTSAISENVQRNSCYPGTRIAILDTIINWAITQEPELQNSLFWLYGLAGTGKTTILHDICERLQKMNFLASSYFCSIQLTSGDSRRLIPTIARHLASCSQVFKDALILQLKRNLDLASAKLELQFEYLLREPWRATVDSTAGHSSPWKVEVIDALDECDRGLEFLNLLLDAINNSQFEGIRFIVSSRPVPALLVKVRTMRPDAPQVSLHELPKQEVSHDIKCYLEASLTLPSPIIDELVALANGLFIYASTLVKYLSPSHDISQAQLERRLDKARTQLPKTTGMNALYTEIVNAAFSLVEEEEIRERREILHTIMCLAEPSPATVVAGVCGADPELVIIVVKSLHSVLFTAGADGPIYIFHASFLDFIVSGAENLFRCHPYIVHSNLADQCLKNLHASLRFNICHLESSFTLDADLTPPLKERVGNYIGDCLAYASRYWLFHVQGSDETDRVGLMQMAEQIMHEKGIFWIEIMSLVDHIQACKEILQELISDSSVIRHVPALKLLALAATNVVTRFTRLPEKITSHLYLSSLALSEPTPPLRRWRDQLPYIPRVMSQEQSASQHCRVVINVDAPIYSLSIAPDGRSIVTGVYHRTVCIWDSESSKELQKLQGHTHFARSVAFSPNGKHVVTGSDDHFLRIWDITSGGQVRVLKGHKNDVVSVAFSPNGEYIVSGSTDKSVRVWIANSGKRFRNPVRHKRPVHSVVFAPDGKRIASASDDHSAVIWDAETLLELCKLEGHSKGVTS
ncbi:hypothetical protein DL96DRAFT_998360 [Flagelloscypha sp. PMI_526]|nr:hypothetical protein DL96DRAFT_998360 [Flagelloscypha sp. PMI_526]